MKYSTLISISAILLTCAVSCNISKNDNSSAENSAEDEIRGVASFTASSTGTSMQPIAIDGPPIKTNTDTFVFASIWAAYCLNPVGPDPMEQTMSGYLDGKGHVESSNFGAYRAISLAFVVPAGHTWDLAVRCSTPATYPVGKIFSLNRSTAQSAVEKAESTTYTAATDGIVTAVVRMKTGGRFQAVYGYVNSQLVAFDADVGEDIAKPLHHVDANITFPVKSGDTYRVVFDDNGGNHDTYITFTAVPGLNLGSYEDKSFHQVYEPPTDGFVLANGWTGTKHRDGFPFQQIDGYMMDASGQWHRMAVKADYGAWRAGSIIFPVLKGLKYKVGIFDPSATSIMKFIPIQEASSSTDPSSPIDEETDDDSDIDSEDEETSTLSLSNAYIEQDVATSGTLDAVKLSLDLYFTGNWQDLKVVLTRRNNASEAMLPITLANFSSLSGSGALNREFTLDSSQLATLNSAGGLKGRWQVKAYRKSSRSGIGWINSATLSFDYH